MSTHFITDEIIAVIADELCKHSEHPLGKSALRSIIRRHLSPVEPLPDTELARLRAIVALVKSYPYLPQQLASKIEAMETSK